MDKTCSLLYTELLWLLILDRSIPISSRTQQTSAVVPQFMYGDTLCFAQVLYIFNLIYLTFAKSSMKEKWKMK